MILWLAFAGLAAALVWANVGIAMFLVTAALFVVKDVIFSVWAKRQLRQGLRAIVTRTSAGAKPQRLSERWKALWRSRFTSPQPQS